MSSTIPGPDTGSPGQPALFEVAHARRSDPETSHAAAASLDDLRARQQAVLGALMQLGPCTDETLVEQYPTIWPGYPQSPSGLRTRRRELCDLGLVEWNGQKRPSSSGRAARVWTVVWGAVR